MNVTRLSRYAHIDHVTSKERLIFTKRGWKWKPLMVWLTVLAAAIFYGLPFVF